jgi:ESF2/ABP1 family protein
MSDDDEPIMADDRFRMMAGMSEDEQEEEGKPLKKEKKKPREPGVCYLGRLPPFLNMMKVRQLLEPYGNVTRIYGALEDATRSKKRKKHTGNRRKNFVEGWVEFDYKKDARRCAETLNARPMGGKKRGKYTEDLWNIRYLRKFKWGQLTEKIQHERSVRDSRTREEMSQQKRENKYFMNNVKKSKGLRKQLDGKGRPATSSNGGKRKFEVFDQDQQSAKPTKSSSSSSTGEVQGDAKRYKRKYTQVAAIRMPLAG